jgi:hypothetical protein
MPHKLMTARLALLALTTVFCGCAAESADASAGSEDDVRSDVTPEGTVLIAFDGTGNYLAQGTVIARVFTNVATTGVRTDSFSFRDTAPQDGAVKDKDWAYRSHVRTDAQGRIRAIYYNGPPEAPTDTRYGDGGAATILGDAFRGDLGSPVCRAIRESATKKVFFVGYSRGAVLAHAAANRVLDGACGSAMAAKVTWVGLVDPVETGHDDNVTVFRQDCDATAIAYHVVGDAPTRGCLSLLRSRSTTAPIPVGVFLKNTEANVKADLFLLSTIPVNGAKHQVFDFSPVDGTKTHIAMGGSGIVYEAFKRDATARGGLRFR